MVDFQGVRNFAWIAPKKLSGNKPSRAIASSTRGWLNIITSSTLVIPAIAPAEISSAANLMPRCANASETGASMLI